jgi:glycosyltransferase involved in cell wall biosynthesis
VTRLTAVTSYGRRAGSARVRVFDWLDRVGVDATTHSYLDGSDNSARSLLRDPFATTFAEARLRSLRAHVGENTVLLSRQASPLSTGTVEAGLLGAAARGVYDFDDALYLSRSPRLFPKSRIWRRAVEAADVVIAGNDVLAEAADGLNAATTIVPSCVDPGDYIVKTDYEVGEVPRAVWIGSPATEKYLDAIAPALTRLHLSHRMRLSLISAGDRDLGALADMTDRIVWDPATVAAELARADVGIMPLPDDPWSRGKCAYKLLQYAAGGLPLVASPVGANAAVLRAGHGLGPSSVDDWGQALTAVIEEGGTARARRGKAARETVVESFSFDAWASRWTAAVGISGHGASDDEDPPGR